MDTTSLGHMPKNEKWEFEQSVTNCFEDMLARSIPQYEVMRDAVFNLAEYYIKPQTAIVDLGCSRGEALAPFIDDGGYGLNTFIGVEVSDTMLAAARSRFKEKLEALRASFSISEDTEERLKKTYIKSAPIPSVDIRKMDLRREYPAELASVTLSVLTLQFTPMEHRQRIVRDVYNHTIPGGAFILVEKILGANSDIDEILVANYYAMKSENGYTQEEIQRKKLSLEGVLVPVTAKWNEELLASAGFHSIDCFWRWMNFAGWIAIKA